jgi:hypothetical protein
MLVVPSTVLVAFAVLHSFLLLQSPPPACADAAACRDAAVAAAARQDFEAFHDLAWRAAQKSRPNDPEVMYLLARAQSLSGRPGDALVMLRRLAQMGVSTDANTNDDFRRVRELAGWPELEAFISSAGSSTRLTAPTGASAVPPSPNPSGAATKPAGSTPEASPAAAPAAPRPAEEPGEVGVGKDTMRLTGAALEPVGLAYDSASRRFVVGDRHDNKLIVADEVFNHVNDLISATSAGFGRLSAVEIDTRRGDLWVTSTEGNGVASVHKLQLVSGRVLARLDMPDSLKPIAISDFAVLDSGGLLLLDSEGGRIVPVKSVAGPFERAIPLKVSGASSLATAEGKVYVAHERGLSVVELSGGRVVEVAPPKGASLGGLRRIRWTRGALLALQENGDSTRMIRIRLSRRGQSATAIEPLDRDTASAGSALTISRDAAYYVAATKDGPAIRRVRLR